MNNEVDFTDQMIAEYIENQSLSMDMTKLNEVSAKSLADILYSKLCFISDDLIETLQGFENEFKNQWNEINKVVNIHNKNKEEINFLLINGDQNLILMNNLSFHKNKINKYLSDFRNNVSVDHSRLILNVLDWVTLATRIRVKYDVIPLMKRGLYANDLVDAISFWEEHKNSEEGKIESIWQKELHNRKILLERVIGASALFFCDQASVGNNRLTGGGNIIADFLLKHKLTRDIIIVEIKTPHTKILGKSYRNLYPLSQEISGSISQVLNQRTEFLKNFHQKAYSLEDRLEAFSPRCIIIAGCAEKELDDESKRKSFSLQINAFRSNVELITFDELYGQFATFNQV